MPKRHFNDDHGMDWEVWDVRPHDILNGQATDESASHLSVAPDLVSGWLCFQTKTERRRFAPIPRAWHELPDGVLRLMLDVSDPVPPNVTSTKLTN